MIARELVRRRAGNRPDLRRIAHIKIDIAPKLERPVDDRMRPDHDPRILVLAPREPVRTLDEDAAFDMRARADLDVAADGLDATADVRRFERDAPVDVRCLAGDVGAVRELDVPVDGLDRPRDARALA